MLLMQEEAGRVLVGKGVPVKGPGAALMRREQAGQGEELGSGPFSNRHTNAAVIASQGSSVMEGGNQGPRAAGRVKVLATNGVSLEACFPAGSSMPNFYFFRRRIRLVNTLPVTHRHPLGHPHPHALGQHIKPVTFRGLSHDVLGIPATDPQPPDPGGVGPNTRGPPLRGDKPRRKLAYFSRAGGGAQISVLLKIRQNKKI